MPQTRALQTAGRRRRRRSAAQAEVFDERPVGVEVATLQVAQQPPPATDQTQ